MKGEFIAGCALGILIGFGGSLALLNLMPESLVVRGNKALRQCEQHLPRDWHCEITAMPEQGGAPWVR